ncbi:DMT family transporter [Neotabrizicola sp. VNH66]|uniref:DMT family transporter n=1 Tax=Neotabrizicola sp. VNH66 TaxID=3400918 RepID=UPI003BFAC67E
MSYRLSVLLCVSAAVLWSLNGLVIRQIEEAGTWAVLFWRSLGTLPVLGLWIVMASGGHPLRQIRATGRWGILGGLALVAAFGGAIFAFQTTTIANAVFLFSASPLIAAVLARLLLNEPVRPATRAAIALAACGVFLMVRDGLSGGAMAGNIAALCSAAGFATFTVALRAGRVAQTMPVSFLGSLFALIAAALMLGISGEDAVPPAADIAISMAMGTVLLAGGMILYTIGSRTLSAAEATLLSQGEVILAPIWVWAVMGETASPATLTGGAVIVSAIALNAVAGARRARPALR